MKNIRFVVVLPALLLLMLSLPQPVAAGPYIKFVVRYPNGVKKPKGGPVFKAVRKGWDLKVINEDSGQIVWQTRAYPSDHGDDLLLYVAPGMKRMLLMHQYGVRGQTLYWAALGTKTAVFAEVPDKAWRDAAARAAGISAESFTDFFVDIVRWKSPNQCFLAWHLTFGEASPYYSGVVSLAFPGADDNTPPVVKAGPRKANMTLEESRRLTEADYEPLIEAWTE